MSLVNQLRQKDSLVSQWMYKNTKSVAIKSFVKAVNDQLVKQSILSVPANTDFSLVGTAFDYSFRWFLGNLESEVVFAMHGANMGPTITWLNIMPDVVRKVVDEGNNTADLQRRTQSSVILSWFEQYGRSGYMPRVLEDLRLKKNTKIDDVIDILYSQVPSVVVEDVLQLLDTVPYVWKQDLQKSFLLNPTFDGSSHVGGADADWIVDGTLYDCKCTKTPRPFGRKMFLQSFGYVLLDYSNRYKIKNVGWYFPRQKTRFLYPISELLQQTFVNPDLSVIRKDFADTMEKAFEERMEKMRLLQTRILKKQNLG